jgi:hypothetical protein
MHVRTHVDDARTTHVDDPASGLKLVTKTGRRKGSRPEAITPLSHPRIPARELEVPQEFRDYGSELGLTGQQYEDALTDWREKERTPSTVVRHCSVLCRFLEAAAGGAASAPEPRPKIWTDPDPAPPGAGPPPPEIAAEIAAKLFAPRKAGT